MREYKLICTIVHRGTVKTDIDTHEKNVTESLNHGWNCVGGIALSYGTGVMQLAQAMISEDEDE